MSIRPGDKLQNGDIVVEDSYEKLSIDIALLTDKLVDVKKEIRNTPWYRIGTHRKLKKEFSLIEDESDKIYERLKKLDIQKMNPIQIVKRP
jgi:hypothetical protein